MTLLPLLRHRINVILKYTAVTEAQLEDKEAADDDSEDPQR